MKRLEIILILTLIILLTIILIIKSKKEKFSPNIPNPRAWRPDEKCKNYCNSEKKLLSNSLNIEIKNIIRDKERKINELKGELSISKYLSNIGNKYGILNINCGLSFAPDYIFDRDRDTYILQDTSNLIELKEIDELKTPSEELNNYINSVDENNIYVIDFDNKNGYNFTMDYVPINSYDIVGPVFQGITIKTIDNRDKLLIRLYGRRNSYLSKIFINGKKYFVRFNNTRDFRYIGRDAFVDSYNNLYIYTSPGDYNPVLLNVDKTNYRLRNGLYISFFEGNLVMDGLGGYLYFYYEEQLNNPNTGRWLKVDGDVETLDNILGNYFKPAEKYKYNSITKKWIRID